MFPAFRRDLSQHVGACEAVREQLVEHHVQLVVRELHPYRARPSRAGQAAPRCPRC